MLTDERLLKIGNIALTLVPCKLIFDRLNFLTPQAWAQAFVISEVLQVDRIDKPASWKKVQFANFAEQISLEACRAYFRNFLTGKGRLRRTDFDLH